VRRWRTGFNARSVIAVATPRAFSELPEQSTSRHPNIAQVAQAWLPLVNLYAASASVHGFGRDLRSNTVAEALLFCPDWPLDIAASTLSISPD
jgi:hypothetical protein